jgi:hypothetical protein
MVTILDFLKHLEMSAFRTYLGLARIAKNIALMASYLNILTWRSAGCRFIYAFLGAGAITCFVSLTGHIAAELSNGFCLSCVSYSNVSNASCDAERKGSCVDLGTFNCALLIL